MKSKNRHDVSKKHDVRELFWFVEEFRWNNEAKFKKKRVRYVKLVHRPYHEPILFREKRWSYHVFIYDRYRDVL